MARLILVHGGWHGGWCWKRVVPLLRAAGHEVHAPTLTGMGERRHLLTRGVNLATHIGDVLGLLEYEDIGDAVLLGHSYGGMVISGVADRAPQRLRRLVYLDAFAPENGDSVASSVPPEQGAAMLKAIETDGEGWLSPVPPLAVWGVVAPDDLAWMNPRVGPQPAKTLTDPIVLANPARLAIPKTYISCVSQQRAAFVAISARIRAEGGWDYRELDAPHDAMVTAPRALADMLIDIAK